MLRLEDRKMTEPRIEKLPLSQCVAMAHPRNPKEHDLDKLIDSFRRFGFVAFPTIDERSQMMVAGHGRCEALAKLRSAGAPPPPGVDEVGVEWMVPVVRGVSFKSERDRDAYLIADNQHVLAGGWKFDSLTALLHDLKTDDALEGLGFASEELDSLLGNYVPEPPADDSDAPPPDDPGTGGGARTTIVATIECPSGGHKFQR
jgi:hypothetical protein